jgi:retron-type reverse transcriptase
MVDQLHISDRVFQHILLRILKPTFKFVMNPNCYHLEGPTGVKNATKKIREVLERSNPKYFIRTDIKSFYKSILHNKLIVDIKKYYDDPKLISMLINIINNPIDTPYGYKNPDHGIALRGPLSQFFSGIYLKPLDDAFNNMDVTYLRYQDDILILCNTKRQLNRCKRKMMQVMNERHLRLSKRKTRMGEIEQSGFHFLGIEYPPTRMVDNTNTTPVLLKKEEKIIPTPDHYLSDEGGGRSLFYSANTGNFTHCADYSACTNFA